MSTTPFPANPTLTGVAMAYRNGRMIADAVAPRKPVPGESFKYHRHVLADKITLPDTRVGRKGVPNEMEFVTEEVDGSTEDHGLDDVVPNKDIDAAAAIPGFDPLATAAENLTDLIELAREVRTANTVFDPANYAESNRTALSGTSMWSDHDGSDPLGAIAEALDTVIVRPNVMVLSRGGWSVLSRHPKILSAVKGRTLSDGIARREEVAELFELEEIVVGEAWLNIARPGQAVSRARVWGDHCALIYRDRLADFQNKRATFALTAQFGTRVAGRIPEQKLGLKGGERVRVGEQVRELILASDMAYLFENIR